MFHHFTNKREPLADEEFDMLDLELGQVYEKDGVVYAKPMPAKPQPSKPPTQLVMENMQRKEEDEHEKKSMSECTVQLWDIFRYVRIVCNIFDARTYARTVCTEARTAFSAVRHHPHDT